ncbi:MAG: hypothetical protein IJ496_01830 [Ruminococcus sp.]|nr:hypothetical protein [Ruminococcus sp.]
MMKMKAFLVVSAVLLASLPVLNVSAADSTSTYQIGDVDMDGYITGHDTAMVSRYVHDDTYALDEGALALADVNEDGTVDQSDADLLYETQEYPLGDVTMDGSIQLNDGTDVLTHCMKQNAGVESELTEVQMNLADVDLDGEVTGLDGTTISRMYALDENGYSYFRTEGVYYIAERVVNSLQDMDYVSGDVDMDGYITGHDTAMVSRYVHDDTYTLTAEQLILADYDMDGDVDQTDADYLYKQQWYPLGDVEMDQTLLMADGTAISTYCIRENAGLSNEWTEVQKNLADTDLDGKITMLDARSVHYMFVRYASDLPYFDTEGVYYITERIVTSYAEVNQIYGSGDVDKDGYITGHDAAMVSKYLDDETYTLTEEQLILADYDMDGDVDQTDADFVYQHQQYALGDVYLSTEGSVVNLDDATEILLYYVRRAASMTHEWTDLQRNLADCDLDGVITIQDASHALTCYARMGAGLSVLDEEGKYYMG